LNAPGRTGKTLLINLLWAKLRSKGIIAIAAVSSGIAATLLDGGQTALALFKLPLNAICGDSGVRNVSKRSSIAKLLQRCSLIVWDESAMSHKILSEALDRTPY